jgi:hypothetical protein
MEEKIESWTARRKTALLLEIIQGKTTVADASWAYDLPPSEIEDWVDDTKRADLPGKLLPLRTQENGFLPWRGAHETESIHRRTDGCDPAGSRPRFGR